jgi:hypothetical protein
MAKTQLNVRVSDAAAHLARSHAEERGISLNQYVESLITSDIGQEGEVFIRTATQLMGEWQDAFVAEFGASEDQSR